MVQVDAADRRPHEQGGGARVHDKLVGSATGGRRIELAC